MQAFVTNRIRCVPIQGTAAIWIVLVACAVLASAHYRSAWGSELHSAPAAARHAQLLVQDTTSRVLAAMARGSDTHTAGERHAFHAVESIVMPHVDLRLVSRQVLGEHWASATRDQQRMFMEEFGAQLVHAYVITMTEYLSISDKLAVTIDYLPVDVDQDRRRAVVRTRVGVANAQVQLDYRLHKFGDQWKVYDVLVDGVSVVRTYRKSFAAEISRVGLDRLIARLADRNKRQQPT